MTTVRTRSFPLSFCFSIALVALTACGSGSAGDGSAGGGGTPMQVDADGGAGCPVGMQDVDGDGTCQPSCDGDEGLACNNGGACVLDASTGVAACECPAAYAGADCSECAPDYQDADEDGVCELRCDAEGAALMCGNGGVCLIGDDGLRACECPEGATGERCDACAPGYVQGTDACVLNLPSTQDLALWLDSEHGVSATGSGTVASWADRRGVGFPFASELSNGQRPTLEVGGTSGRDTVFFDGDDDRLSVSLFDGLTGPQYSVFVVARTTGLAESHTVLSFVQDGTAYDAITLTRQSDEDEDAYSFWHRSGANAADTVTILADEGRFPQALSVIRHDAQGTAFDRMSLLTSNAEYDQVTDFENVPLTTGVLKLGIGASGTFSGHLGEVLIYARSLDSAERVAVLQYLSAKWGIQLAAL